MERVAVERELGNGQGDIMTRNPNGNLVVCCFRYLVLVLMLY